jgi:hypothetical protein
MKALRSLCRFSPQTVEGRSAKVSRYLRRFVITGGHRRGSNPKAIKTTPLVFRSLQHFTVSWEGENRDFLPWVTARNIQY